MITSLDQLDFNATYSYADYLTWQFDEFVELIKGKIMPMSAPTRLHQEAVTNLTVIIGSHLKQNYLDCKVYVAPFDVRLLRNPTESLENRLGKTDKEVYTVVQPDICVICDLEKLDDKGCNGAPNLIIEIVSEKSAAGAKRDVVDKYELYSENGVLEYWLARPLEKTVQKFLLNGSNKYESQGYFAIDDEITCSILPNLTIPINDIFR
jgi:Uma2 family endonuclease